MSFESDPSLQIEKGATPRDRRQAFRVSLPRLEATFASPIELVDISLTGVGFMARREDAVLLDGARLLVHLNRQTSLHASVERVELGTPSDEWVRVGARFSGLEDDERACLSALVTSRSC